MSYGAHLWLFFVLVFGAVILPGMDMAYILGSALTGGRRNGFAAVAGAVAGAAIHSVFATLGIGLLLQTLPGAFDVLLLAGAAFIAWIGVGVLRSAATDGTAAVATPQATSDLRPVATPGATWLRATANNLLNPNAYLFTLAVFPQFIVPGRGPIGAQAALLWLIIAATQTGVYGSVVLVAAQVQHALRAHPAAQRRVRIAVGVLLLAVGTIGGLSGWARLHA